MSKKPDNTWMRTFEKDFLNIQPGDLVKINQISHVAIRTKTDKNGRFWIRLTHDCNITPPSLRRDWISYSAWNPSEYSITSDQSDSDDELIRSFHVTPDAGKEYLEKFNGMIWEENLRGIPRPEEVFPPDGDPYTVENECIQKIMDSIQANTLLDEEARNLLLALEMVGCVLTHKQKKMILRISNLMYNALDEMTKPKEPKVEFVHRTLQ